MADNTDLQNNDGLDLSDVGAIIRRRIWALILPFVVVSVLAVVIAFSLPPVYRSEATVLVEGEEIPAEFVESTVTGYVEQRIQVRDRVAGQ